MLAVVPRGLGEAVVEETEAPAGDVRNQAVKDLAARLVGIEAQVEKVSQESSALRNTKAVRALDRRLAVCQQGVLLARVVTQERHQVAHGGKAGPLHNRPLGLADQLVNIA